MSWNPLRPALVLGFALPILTLLGACGPRAAESSVVDAAGGQVGRFKGYVAIDQALRQRVVAPTDASFHLGRYLGSNEPGFTGLVTLLGGFSGQGNTNQFRSGDPNALNMLLWQLSLGLFADDVAKGCSPSDTAHGGAFTMRADIAARLQPLCAWPDAAAKTEANMLGLWLGVMGYAAPQAEFVAWRDYFLDSASSYAQAPAKEAVQAMVVAMLLNPNFLLER